MLLKLIKYDLQNGLKQYAIMFGIALAIIISTIISAVAESDFMIGMSVLTAVLATVALVCLFIFVSVSGFRRHLGKNESYLTYTLPVSESRIILSKLITVFIWWMLVAVSIVAVWATVTQFIFLANSNENVIDTFRSFLDMFEIEYTTIFFTFLFMFIFQITFVIALMLFCVALMNIPAIRNKNWGLPVALLTGFISYQGTGILAVVIWWFIRGMYDGLSTMEAGNSAVISMLWVLAAMYFIVSVIFYFLSIFTVKRHRQV